ncbi:MAG TPA: AMP-binding protein, partial [Dehalococcoidia bacterium]|nr:AMP-binding protein [Dehalococcoidia bacterium]
MPIVSPWPSLEPYPKSSLPAWIERTSLKHGDKPAFIFHDSTVYSFRETFELARRIGRLLQERGIVKGDRIAFITPNSPSLVIAALGVMWAGAIVQLLNPLLKERELKYFLTLSGARAGVVSGEPLSRVEAIKGELPDLEALYSPEELEGRAREVPPEPWPVEIDAQQDGVLLFNTSGTTGIPKGLLHTHYSILAEIRRLVLAEGRNARCVFLDITPLFLSFGFNSNGVGALLAGATQVVMPRFDAEQALALIERYRVTNIAPPPLALVPMTEAARRSSRDLSSLAFLWVGGAALSRDQENKTREALPQVNIRRAYGIAEVSCINSGPPLGAKSESVGPPLPDTTEKVVDLESGEEVGPGETGELLVKGPQIFRGYWQNPEADAEAFTPDGWFRTGDIVRADEEGYIYILDRRKQMIKYKGYQVSPVELEVVLGEHPAVLEAVVIPKQAPDVGEVPKAFVVLKPGVQASPEELKEELMAFVEERVAPY